MDQVYNRILESKKQGRKSLAVLIDPDKLSLQECIKTVNTAVECKVDYFFVGGSLVTDDSLSEKIACIKELTSTPVVIFPGNSQHIDDKADAILLLSLLSGRNADLLIGQHVLAAPFLKRANIEILSTGYILIDGGKQTTVSYISNSNPIPRDKPEIAACTAMAGEMLGMKLIYLDAGSGALNEVPESVVRQVAKNVDAPIIVGGGINDAEKLKRGFAAGADVLVLGNILEKKPEFIIQASEILNSINDLNVY